jgi:23S rRNA pseudouridine1911/1915/1917 synthase
MASRRFRLIQQRVIFEDNHVIIYDKPSGLRVQPCPSHPSLHDEIKYFLSTKYSKKGNVYLGVVHRLDRLTSGGIILAKTSKAASRLSESMRNNQIKKHYLAIVHGSLSLKQKSCEDYINDQMNPVKILSYQSYQKMRLSDPNIERDFKYSSASISPICSFQALYSSPPISSSFTLPSSACTALSVELQTGRKHQIRVQLSSRGHPILGDTKYHAPRNYHISPTGATPGYINHFPFITSHATHHRLIGLHSYEVSFPHPTTKQMVRRA